MLLLNQVEVGQELPPLKRTITPVQMMMYGAATWDFSRLHYDTPFVQKRGFDRIFVDRQMLGALVAKMIVDWIGEPTALKKLSVRYAKFVYPGDTITCYGRITEICPEKSSVCCELWIENQDGERVLDPGSAEVVLQTQ